MGDLTANFSKHEFVCKCGSCEKMDIQPVFVTRLQSAKDYLESKGRHFPIIILSGVRCEKHNKEVGGEPDSSHIAGWAADIQCKDNETRYWLKFALMMVGFNRYGVDKQRGFVHVDCDPSKPPYREWVYPL